MSVELGIQDEDGFVDRHSSSTNGNHLASENVINGGVKIKIDDMNLSIEEEDLFIEEKDLPIEKTYIVIKEKDLPIEEKDTVIKEKDLPIMEKDIPLEDISLPSESLLAIPTKNSVDDNSNDTEDPQVATVFVKNQVPKKKYPFRKNVRSVPPKARNKKGQFLTNSGIITDEKEVSNEVIGTESGEAAESAVINESIDQSSNEKVSDNTTESTRKSLEGVKTRKITNKTVVKDPNRTKLGRFKKQRKQKSEDNKTSKDTLENEDSDESKEAQDLEHLVEAKSSKAKVRKPRECEVCKRVFANYGSLKEHKRIHSGEKPFICPICGIGCIRRGYLKQHIFHHTGEWPYKCAACGKGFINKSRIQRHMRVHSDDRPFLCDVCGEGFKEPHHLTRHFLLHTGEKPFKCELCPDRYFLQHGNLKIHMKTHQNGGKPKRQTNSESCSMVSVGQEVLQRPYQDFEELIEQNKQKNQPKTVFTTQQLLYIPKETGTADQELETTVNISSQLKDSDYHSQNGENTLPSPSKQDNICEISSPNVSNAEEPVNLAYTIALPLQNSICTTVSQNMPLTGTLTLVDSRNSEGITHDVNPNLVHILGNIDLTNLSGLQHLETLTTLNEDQADACQPALGCSQNAYVIAQQLSSAEDGSVIALQLNPEEASAIAQIFLNSQQ